MSGQKIIDGLQEVIDGKIAGTITVLVPEPKIFPVPEHMLTREQKRYLANRGYDTGVPPSVRRHQLLVQ